jgi:hypothetical protein
MRRQRARQQQAAPWTDEDFMIRAISSGLIVESGSEQRALPCVLCKEAIGGERAVMIALVSPFVCQAGGKHLNGAGFLRHETCQPLNRMELVSACIKALDCILQ